MPMQACAPQPRRLAADPRRRRALISMTPLIDVVFILLIFFMLASSFLNWRIIGLDLPGPGGTPPAASQPLVVEVQADGIVLAGERLDLEGLVERVAPRIAEDPERAVLVRPAAGVPLQDAIRVLDRLGVAGVTAMRLVGERKAVPAQP
jgi:biopolymer transport protein ExbD